jgi:hypothetical protein
LSVRSFKWRVTNNRIKPRWINNILSINRTHTLWTRTACVTLNEMYWRRLTVFLWREQLNSITTSKAPEVLRGRFSHQK